MLTANERKALRDMRDDVDGMDDEDRKTLRKAINYISVLESKLHAVRTFAKAIDKEAQFKEQSDG